MSEYKELTMIDMNSLNAVASLLNHYGLYGHASTVLSIQEKATRMILRYGSEEARCGLPKDDECN